MIDYFKVAFILSLWSGFVFMAGYVASNLRNPYGASAMATEADTQRKRARVSEALVSEVVKVLRDGWVL